MDYYIQGDAAKADKIKAAFEKLGYDTLRHLFNAKSVLYFTFNGEIRATTDKLFKTFIKSRHDYQELPLPVKSKFKIGNWIVRNNGSSDIPIQVYGLKKDRYLVTNMLGSKGELMINRQDEWHLWTIQDAEDGDVLVTTTIRNCPFIYRKTSYKNNLAYYYVGIDGNGDLTHSYPKNTLCHFGPASDVAPATKERRDLLFAKIKEAGYEWNAEKKELRKIKPHYDIKNFHAGMPVLVRADNDCSWDYSVFSRITGNEYWHFSVCNGVSFTQCIPLNDDTKHLLGTTDMPSEEFINW